MPVISAGGLGRLRQENHLNLGGRGCSELRLYHCTIAQATERDPISKKKKRKKKNVKNVAFYSKVMCACRPHIKLKFKITLYNFSYVRVHNYK